MVDGVIEFYSNYFTILPRTPKLRAVNRTYLEGLIEKKLVKKRGRFHMEPSCVYAARSLKNGTYSMHINDYETFFYYLETNGFRKENFEFITHVPKPGKKVELSMGEYLPWDNQIPVIDFALKSGFQTCITTQPGGGKTLMFLFIAAAIGERFAVQTMGGWEGRWIEAFYKFLGLQPEEVRSCCGCSRLYKLIREKKTKGIDGVKAIFISNGAIRTYIKNYEMGTDKGSGAEDIPPYKLYEFLEVGLRGTDETHREFHANYIADLHTHISKTVYLTGTLFPRDAFTKRVYEILLPQSIRKEASELRVYADAVEVLYNLERPELFDSFLKNKVYSHNEYEKVYLRNPKLLDRYLSATYNYTLDRWVLEREEGTKILLFFGLVEMGQEVLKYFRRRLPDLIVETFNAGDDYYTLEKADVIISTVLKAGTAVDIPDLTQVHNHVSVDSPNQNVQCLGRLRELPHRPDVQVEYHFTVCLDIPKQKEYSVKRKKLFKDRVRKIRTNYLGALI